MPDECETVVMGGINAWCHNGKPAAPLKKSLAGFYRNNGTDWSGNNRHMHIENAGNPPSKVTGLNGVANAAMEIHNSAWFKLPYPFVTGGAFSLAGFYKPVGEVPGSEQSLIAFDDSLGVCALYISDGGTLRFRVGAESIVSGSDPDFENLRWHHLAGTYDGRTAKLYWDGVLRNTAQLTAEYSGFVLTALGNMVNIPGLYLQNLGIWNRAISAKEVLTLYNGGAGYDPTL